MRRLLSEFAECDPFILEDLSALEVLLSAAPGQPLVHSQLHPSPGGGVIGTVTFDGSFLTLHTTPEKGYAAANYFSADDWDPLPAHAHLEAGLKAGHSVVLEVEHGRSARARPLIRGHRSYLRLKLDCRTPRLPSTVRAGDSGVLTTRAFEKGEPIYPVRFRFVPFDTVFEVKTDHDCYELEADDMGVEVTPEVLKSLPRPLLEELARNYGIPTPDPVVLRERVTDRRRNEVLVSTLNGLVNFAHEANFTVDKPSLSLVFEDEKPVFLGRTVALKPLQSGAELFWSYSGPEDSLVPREWLL